MKLTPIEIDKIIPYEKNVKRHSELQIEKIGKSIKDVWFIQPLVVDENYVILIGHWRFEAMKSLWEKTVDCVVLKGLSEEQKKALRIRDNKLNESPYDISNLSDELQSLFDMWIDLTDLWYSLKELEEFNIKIENLGEDLSAEESLSQFENEWNSAFSEWNDQQNWGENSAFSYSQVQWNQGGEKHVMTFYLTDSEQALLWDFYKTSRKWESNVELLMEVTKFYIDNHQDEASD